MQEQKTRAREARKALGDLGLSLIHISKPDQREGDLVQVPYLRREAAASERPAVSGTGHAVTGG